MPASPRPNTAPRRKPRPSRQAARLLRATPHFFTYLDGELPNTDEVAHQLARLLRRLQPQVIITHWRDSIHQDHTNTYHLVRGASSDLGDDP